MRKVPIALGAMLVALIVPDLVHAQWLNYPSAGIPRIPDGKPNLSAAAPRLAGGRPDFSGVWRWNPGRYGSDVTLDLKPGEVPSWAAALMEERQENRVKDDPAMIQCLPQGPRANLLPVHLAKVIQLPALIVILYENMSFRQIFMDGRDLPKDPNPSWMGYSVGRWEGDTLVVESTGFTDRSWLDFAGHPHTEHLRVTERFRRTSFGRIEMDTTFDDPSVYSRPWTISTGGALVPDTDLLEYVCENERSSPHLVGKASDGIDPGAIVKLPVEMLGRYVGVYEFRLPETPTTTRTVQVTSKGDALSFEGRRPLAALSDTLFVLLTGQGIRFEFIRGANGTFDQLRIHRVGGCGGSSGVAMNVTCGEAAGPVAGTRRVDRP